MTSEISCCDLEYESEKCNAEKTSTSYKTVCEQKESHLLLCSYITQVSSWSSVETLT